MAKFGAVKGPEGAVVSGKRSREVLAGPGNPDTALCGIARSRFDISQSQDTIFSASVKAVKATT
jgi:hypothetical protein